MYKKYRLEKSKKMGRKWNIKWNIESTVFVCCGL